MGEELTKDAAKLKNLQAELDWYKRLYPETTIFYRKVKMTEILIRGSLEDLQNAPDQPWYAEYLSLLAIRLENTPLSFMCKQCVDDLMRWYNQYAKYNERELAVIGMIQLVNPADLTIPLNHQFWHKQLIADVRAIFWNGYIESNYTDEGIATYYLARQYNLRNEKRKIRVAFLSNSYGVAEKFLPVYDAMRERDDIEPFLVMYPDEQLRHRDGSWKFFYEHYPRDEIYNSNITDLQTLRPDYVFIPNPYENRRNGFYGTRITDLVKFSKPCIISYGATLAYKFAERLFEDFPNFCRNLYFTFASAQTVKTLMIEKFPKNVAMNYQHIEFLGYPQLKRYYETEMKPYAAKHVLWTPRWNYGNKIGGSHFLPYKNKFIALRQKYGSAIQLSMRPHPNLFDELKKMEIMDDDKITEFRETLKANDIALPTTYLDMHETIRDVDIFLADYSSIMVCLFLTGRPIIYCEYPEAVPLPEYEEMFSAMYIARTWEDVERYLDDLLAGNDPLFDKRQEAAKKIYETHKDAAEKIIERIVQDFNESLLR